MTANQLPREYGPHEPNLFDTAEPQADLQPAPELTAEPASVFQAPESVRPAIEATDAERSAAFDRVDANHPFTDAQKREVAGIITAEDINARAVRAAGAMLKQAAKPKRRRRSTDGPPPHIQEEVRRARGY